MVARSAGWATKAGIIRPMYKLLIALSLVPFANAQTRGTTQTLVLATIHQFVDGFNKGDRKTLLAACADQTSILDEFPPHEWHGTGACAKWVDDFDSDAKKNGITDGIVTLSNPSHVDITAGRAYVVVPANYTFRQKGKPVSEIGSIITLTLQESKGGWRITGWSWAKH
jgi:hypothetical protein